MNILFVCTGNTCRSPMAEAILKDKVPRWHVKSAGIFAQDGAPLSKGAETVLESRDIWFLHKSRLLTEELLDWADYVFTMTTTHKEILAEINEVHADKYFVLKQFAHEEKGDSDHSFVEPINESMNISDPFGQDLAQYEIAMNEIEKAVAALVERLT